MSFNEFTVDWEQGLDIMDTRNTMDDSKQWTEITMLAPLKLNIKMLAVQEVIAMQI